MAAEVELAAEVEMEQQDSLTLMVELVVTVVIKEVLVLLHGQMHRIML